MKKKTLFVIILIIVILALVYYSNRLFELPDQYDPGQLESIQTQLGQGYTIDRLDDVNDYIYIRHTGTATGDTSFAYVYINEQLVACVWDVSGIWPVNATKRCTAAFSCDSNTTIRIVSSNKGDENRC